MTLAFVLALAGAAAATPEAWPPPKASVLPQQPPVIVTDSPPPIVAAPSVPGTPVLVPHPISPPAPPPPRAVLRPPQPRTALQALISANDYPASALRMGAHGRVRFILDVGPDGRVHGCMITRSSGSSALDSTTCALRRRRARFTPAVDSNGMPAAGRVRDQIEWVLPEQTGVERG